MHSPYLMNKIYFTEILLFYQTSGKQIKSFSQNKLKLILFLFKQNQFQYIPFLNNVSLIVICLNKYLVNVLHFSSFHNKYEQIN